MGVYHNCFTMYFISFSLFILFLATNNFVVTGLSTGILHWITFHDTLGPIHNIFCGLSATCTTCSYWWTFSGKTIAGNGALIEASSFSLQRNVVTPNHLYGVFLQIRNALKTDIGEYTWHVSKDNKKLG